MWPVYEYMYELMTITTYYIYIFTIATLDHSGNAREKGIELVKLCQWSVVLVAQQTGE